MKVIKKGSKMIFCWMQQTHSCPLEKANNKDIRLYITKVGFRESVTGELFLCFQIFSFKIRIVPDLQDPWDSIFDIPHICNVLSEKMNNFLWNKSNKEEVGFIELIMAIAMFKPYNKRYCLWKDFRNIAKHKPGFIWRIYNNTYLWGKETQSFTKLSFNIITAFRNRF